ncbi:MAG: penicillin-binding protein 2 [Candidatus Pacebacteria bacterium]|nr:penicillin-binding protein 2 [Candidatus Paceibacterota bacterium]
MWGRLSFLSIAFILVYCTLIFQVYSLQISNGDIYITKAEEQNKTLEFLKALRGAIYFTDKNDNRTPVALNKNYPTIYAVPEKIQDPADAASKISALLGLDKAKLLEMFSKQNDPYESILKKATTEQARAAMDLGIKGIYITDENFRLYQFNNLGATVLGFIAPTADNDVPKGKYGIESYFNDQLSGENGRIKGDTVENSNPGEEIVLTIDLNIQTKAQEVLSALVEKYNAESGTIIVQDPYTGKILAMENAPSFDPNNYADFKLKDFMNPAVQSIYEPGSVFKLVTMSAGIDSGNLTPDTTFVDKGFVKLNGRTIKNWDDKAYGKITMTGVIENSVNTGAVYAEKLMGNDVFYNYLIKFGLNEKTGIKLPGEINGDIRKLKTSYKDVDFATASFGQGVAVTPLQMISVVSTIANGGTLMKPIIISGDKPQEVRRVISNETALKVKDMMVAAVIKNKMAIIPNYYAAGKTGTAQAPDFKNGGYLDEYNHTFVGFLPANNPKFAVLIRLEKPKGVRVANATVAPAFKDLAEFIINYYNIPPDYVDKPLTKK